MKKLNKPPEAQKVIHYGSAGGYGWDNGFIFSDQLPWMKKKIKDYQKEYKKNGKKQKL